MNSLVVQFSATVGFFLHARGAHLNMVLVIWTDSESVCVSATLPRGISSWACKGYIWAENLTKQVKKSSSSG